MTRETSIATNIQDNKGDTYSYKYTETSIATNIQHNRGDTYSYK